MTDMPDQLTATDPSTTRDWRDTVFLPKTDFPMKAGLPQKEPGILAKWQADDLYAQVRASRAGREKFILHDGPPYANGDMHIGHALNHILKDMVVRTQTLLGKDAPYVPGWDCHGLPIEWKVEEAYRKQKRNKDDVPAAEFRAECRAYAAHWVDVQREQLKRLGGLGDWDHPYLTMDFAAEATIVAELCKFAESGQLYRGAKPVMWSPVEKTALADAEVEYEDIVSTQIDVAFEIVESPMPELVGAYAVVWTTTPWTIPVNQAIAYGPEIAYRLYEIAVTVDSVGGEDAFAHPSIAIEGFKVLLAESDVLLPEFNERLSKLWPRAGAIDQELWSGRGADLAGTVARHPMANHLRHPSESRDRSRVEGAPATGDPSVRWDDVKVGGDRSRGEGTPAAGDPSFRGDDGTFRWDDASWERAREFFARPRPFLPGDFVTTDQGTGLVHMAPDHGEDDFDLCKANAIEPVFAVEGDGKYRADWAWLGGQGSVINAKFNAPDGPICTDLAHVGALLAASADYKHSYPHSWRSKAKLIFRATPQWFIAIDQSLPLAAGERDSVRSAQGEGLSSVESPLPGAARLFLPPEGEGRTLREVALAAIADTRWVPAKGQNRITAMVEGRPDWVISRQRAWGVPITLFVDRRTGQYLNDFHVNARIVAAVRELGVDAWTDEATAGLLGAERDPADYERVTDILDVWFDSGCTHAFVLESGKWPDLRAPADLYLEGSDQHRGWFQSSLLEACGTRGRAPYQAVLTHGFTMDAKGMKMSKSLGNTIAPGDLMRDYGADILRLWALSVDFTEDHRIGKEILSGVADQYRKLRNTFRYLLGALDGYDERERVDVADMPELERYMLHLVAELDAGLRAAVAAYDFNSYVRLLSDFANNDLSAFFFDIRKDVLYCDVGPACPRGSATRRAYRSVLDTLFHALVRWAAPVLVFTAEEVWAARYPDAGSVHLLEWPEVPATEGAAMARWPVLRAVRAQVNEAIEPLRREKTIRSSLEAAVALAGYSTVLAEVQDAELTELLIAASVTYQPQIGGNTGSDEVAVIVQRTTDHKCGRCWRHLPEVGDDGALCDRCATMVGA